MAYLRPRVTTQQQLLAHGLLVEPGPEQQDDAFDVFGNTRTFISLQTPHEQLRVVARSLVVTTTDTMPGSAVAWEQVRERYRYHADGASIGALTTLRQALGRYSDAAFDLSDVVGTTYFTHSGESKQSVGL